MNRKTLFLTVVLLFLCSLVFAKPFAFIQIADTQLGWDSQTDFAKDVAKVDIAVEKINILKPDFLILCGDMTNHTYDIPQIEALKKSLAKLTVPVYFVTGNHDIHFESPSELPDAIRKYNEIYGKDYYKFVHEDTLFVILNTERIKYYGGVRNGLYEKAQRNWLKNVFDSPETYEHTFVAVHAPFFVDSFDEGAERDDISFETRKDYFDLFEKGGVEYILSGHTHAEIIRTHNNINLITNTGLVWSWDKKPDGLRIFKVYPDKVEHEYVAFDKIDSPIVL